MPVQTTDTATVRLPNDRKATVEKKNTRSSYSARVSVSLDREWVFGVDDDRYAELLATYNERGDLATVPIPDWMPYVLDEIGLEGFDA
ncbi:hypothetical protein [Halorussus marinus]|uniref:hypothetical protein n=1 Tax=Halorussus marinus TaxID=2505976 RepID=UPI001091CDB4|nr:hypothetical protein [Halorussus marinus]